MRGGTEEVVDEQLGVDLRDEGWGFWEGGEEIEDGVNAWGSNAHPLKDSFMCFCVRNCHFC